MGYYSRYILPKLIDLACSAKPISKQREKIVPEAFGEVLEVGVGSGLNLGYYDPGKVSKLWGLEPSVEMRKKAEPRVSRIPFEFEFVGLPAGEIPLEDDSVDTVMITYTLCSIEEPLPALSGMARVLRPGGKLLFCEHGASPDAGVRKWQDRVTPLWKRIGGGCHLNRDIPKLLEDGGFRVESVETMYIPGWRTASFNFWGSATQA